MEGHNWEPLERDKVKTGVKADCGGLNEGESEGEGESEDEDEDKDKGKGGGDDPERRVPARVVEQKDY